MFKRAFRSLIVGAAAVTLYNTPALAQMVEIQGIVVTNQNGRLTVKTPQGDQTITLAPDARIRSVSGPLGGQKETVPATALIPGLPVVIEADNSSGQLVANDVEYKAKDYKTAAQIQAGVQETARREAELRSAYSKIGSWDIRAEENIYFKTGSAVISAADKQKLLKLAQNAAGVKGYVISVLGYADPTGNAAANERLSDRRAQAVINYLKQSGKVLPGRVLGASAMGEMNIPTDQPDTKAAYQSARRVTVRVLTSSAHLQQ
jgi:outer membrane protein OmpA-like peptidoglycan-associated protein